MMNRKKRVTCKLTVAAIFIGLAAGLMLPVFNTRLGTVDRPVDPTDALPALQGEPAIRRLKEQGLFDSLQKAVESLRYEIRWEQQPALRHLSASYCAPNPTQKLIAYFTSHGLHLAPRYEATNTHRGSNQAPWLADMKLIGYGYGESLLPVAPAELVAEDNRIEYRRKGLPLVEWYVNKAEGLEQGFTIEAPPGAVRWPSAGRHSRWERRVTILALMPIKPRFMSSHVTVAAGMTGRN